MRVSVNKLTEENIEKYATLIENVGQAIKGTTQPSEYVEPDVNGYWIKQTFWEKVGVTLEEWIKRVKHKLNPSK